MNNLSSTAIRQSLSTNNIEDFDAALTHAQLKGAVEHLPLALRGFREDFEALIKNPSIQEAVNKPINAKRFGFIDLFAGIGGFRIALEKYKGECRFSSEWDKGAQKTYYSNFGEVPYGDINRYAGENVSDQEIAENFPEHDVLAAGFPCQPFSNAGVSARNSLGLAHGFECKTQGTLFYTVARIANIKQPKILFLENVRNIVSHDEGRTFETIKSVVEEIGYKFHYALLNSSSLVPQRRIRCYMVCVRKDLVEKHGAFDFPVFEGEPLPLSSIIEDNVDDVYTISDKLWQGHINRTERNLERGTGFTAKVADLDRPSNTIVSRYGQDGKECLIPQMGKNPRKLTIDECIRLFGFPKDYVKPSSRSAAYKQFGNSVVVPVIEKIAGKFIDQYL
ncbi:MAG: DNA cytosine methyltransferase [Ekhidna sp.]